MSKVKGQRLKVNGFTLIELLVVIAIIAILFAVILIAINPAQRFKDSRNARRLSDVQSIVGATTTYTADKKGTPPANISDGQCIGTKPATVVSDASPVPRAHWKFDNNLTDTSGNGFNGTWAGATYANTPKIGIAALSIQDSLGSVSVSTIDNPTNALTAEGWMKLNQKVEAGTFDHHQALFDKGNYQIQLNSDTGRMEWRVQNGSGLFNEYSGATDNIRGINTFTQFQDTLYAGALKENGASDYGVILKKSGSGWSIDASYPSGSSDINALAVYNGKLYVGQTSSDNKPRVYVFDGISWQNTNLENVITASNVDVLALARFRGKLYAGLGRSVVGDTYIAEYDGSNWRISRQFNNVIEAYSVNSLAVFNGKLYAGTGRGAGNSNARVFEFDGTSWTQKFAPGQLFSKDAVYSLAEYEKQLFIGLGGSVAADGKIYSWDGSAPNPTLTTVFGALFGYKTLSFGIIDGILYGGWGGTSNGQAQFVQWDRTNSRWVPGGSFAGVEVKSFYSYRGSLYLGTKASDTTTLSDIKKIGNDGFVESGKSKWQPNVWYHIAGVYDGSNTQMKLIINGSVDSTQTGAPPTITANTFPLYLGIGYGSDAFSGVIDDFAVHHSVLSDTTIASHAGCYNLGQYLAPEYMGSLPIDPSSTVTDGTDTGYFISKDTGGVITITAPLTETSSSIPEIIKASR